MYYNLTLKNTEKFTDVTHHRFIILLPSVHPSGKKHFSLFDYE